MRCHGPEFLVHRYPICQKEVLTQQRLKQHDVHLEKHRPEESERSSNTTKIETVWLV